MTKFNVADVKLATKPLPELATKLHIEQLIQRPVEACSNIAQPVVREQYHGLINSAALAFNDHRPLCLSPDMIWLTIAQGFAQHVNNNAEAMRHRFVSHEGKEKIVVQRDEFLRGSPENNWESVFDEFSTQIQGYIGEQTHSMICSNFSTTGRVEKAASEIVLMDAMKSYFTYEVWTCCGIPSIELEGTVEDWELLEQKVWQLQDLVPDWWYFALETIAYEFVKAAKGDVNNDWWKSIYGLYGGSGKSEITGWLVRLIPYVKDYSHPEYTLKNPAIAQDYCGPSSDEIPSALAKVPFMWNYYGVEYPYEFVAGIIGATQDSGQMIRPQIGWAVVDLSNESEINPTKTAKVRYQDEPGQITVIPGETALLRAEFVIREDVGVVLINDHGVTHVDRQ